MSPRESSDEIDRAAAEWVARLDGRDATADSAFQAWAAADPRRLGAFIRSQAAWGLLDRASALPKGAAPQAAQRGMAPPSRRVLIGGGLAAAAATAFAVPFLGDHVETFAMPPGELREARLSDGSRVWIGAGTALAGRFSRSRRLIELQQGQAWFEVAKDAHRPFLIRAGLIEVQAVGTAFSVSAEAGRDEVLVTEGVVQVAGRGAGRIPGARLRQGMRALARTNAPLEVVAVDPGETARLLAWRDGKVALDGETVAEAAVQFNRFNTRKLIIDDAALADEPIVGLFEARDPDAFADALELSYAASVDRSPTQIRLGRKKIG